MKRVELVVLVEQLQNVRNTYDIVHTLQFRQHPLSGTTRVSRYQCGPTPMTCGSCSCREHITNSVIGVSRPPVLDCGTTFHPDYGGRDLPSTPSDGLRNLIYLATEALSDPFELRGAIEISLPIYLSNYQKGKASGSGISWAICKSASRSRQITMPAPHHSVFYRPDALPAAQPTALKH